VDVVATLAWACASNENLHSTDSSTTTATTTTNSNVTLSCPFKDDETVAAPGDATGLTMNTLLKDSTGIEAGQIKAASSQASKQSSTE
jgi:hypothetical protein